MVISTLSGYLIVQEPATKRSAQPAPKAPATTSQEAQSLADKSLGDQIKEQVRAQIAGAVAQPGTGVPSYDANDVIPPQAVDISLAFFFTMAAIIIGLPIARAFARRMDRRGGTAQIPNEVSAQLAQLNQAVDAIALEVERISEGQRFTTRLLSEQRDAARPTLPSAADR